MKEQSFEFDVNDFLLVPKSVMRDVLELYTPSFFHPEVKERSFEASVLYEQAFDQGAKFASHERTPFGNEHDMELEEAELIDIYYTEKMILP